MQTRSAVLTAAVVLALAGAGCSKQGKYTSEGAELAQKRMAQLKSGTDWQMAHQQFLSGDLDKSLKNVDRSISLNPEVTKSHVLRGRILLEQGKLEAAREALTKAESLEPTNVEAQYFLGIVCERTSRFDEALQRYTKAGELDPANPQYVVAAAEMLIQLKRYDEASQLLESKQSQFSYNAAIRQTQGQLLMLRRDFSGAAVAFNDALLLAPDDQRIMEDLLQAQLLGRDFAQAEFTVMRLMQIPANADRKDLEVVKARCMIGLNRPVEARSMLLALTSSPEFASDPSIWIDLGLVAGELNDRINLRNAGQRVMAMAGDRPEGYMFRAQFLRLDKRPQEALAFAEQAVARAGSDGSPLAVKSQILRDLGRQADAQQALASALAMDPGNRLVQNLSRGQTPNQPATIVTHPDGQ